MEWNVNSIIVIESVYGVTIYYVQMTIKLVLEKPF